jgi:hypothetical protein
MGGYSLGYSVISVYCPRGINYQSYIPKSNMKPDVDMKHNNFAILSINRVLEK